MQNKKSVHYVKELQTLCIKENYLFSCNVGEANKKDHWFKVLCEKYGMRFCFLLTTHILHCFKQHNFFISVTKFSGIKMCFLEIEVKSEEKIYKSRYKTGHKNNTFDKLI